MSCQILSRLSDSNRGPTVYKTVALPTELRRHITENMYYDTLIFSIFKGLAMIDIAQIR